MAETEKKEIYYLNNKGEKQDLSEWPVAITDITPLYGKTWTPYVKENKAKNRAKILRIYRTTREIDLPVSIYADSHTEFADLMNTLEDITDYDIGIETPGKLYVGEWYLECFVEQATPAEYEPLFYTVDTTLKVYSASPHWIRETTKHYMQTGSEDEDDTVASDSEYLNFDYNFDYNYARYGGISAVKNDTVTASDFQMIIYGPISNPAVTINGHLYQVNVDLATGEYLVIDTRTPSIILYHSDGTTESEYANRDLDNYIFELIQPGSNTVLWPGTFSFDLTVYERRSEPEW